MFIRFDLTRRRLLCFACIFPIDKRLKDPNLSSISFAKIMNTAPISKTWYAVPGNCSGPKRNCPPTNIICASHLYSESFRIRPTELAIRHKACISLKVLWCKRIGIGRVRLELVALSDSVF